jgi:hypothetical protein
MSLEMVGDPNILAKSVVNIQGVGQRLSGNYYVTSAEHSVTEKTYTLKLELRKDATGSYARRAARREEGLPEVASTRATGNRAPEAAQEENPPSVDDTSEAQAVDMVDPGTLETRTTYVQRRGRDSRTGGGRPQNPASTEAAQAGRGSGGGGGT